MNQIQRLYYGGLRHIRQPVALVMNNEEVELLIPLYDLENRDTEVKLII